jgi:hypothetical protein
VIDYETRPCCYGGDHDVNCPYNDWDGDEIQTMTRDELIDLAGKGDAAAMSVLANAVEFDDTIGEIEAATDEEIGQWYADALKETA